MQRCCDVASVPLGDGGVQYAPPASVVPDLTKAVPPDVSLQRLL